MRIQNNVQLAPYTSFGVGGPAQHFALVKDADELLDALRCTLPETTLNLIGFGSNSLISDRGLEGMTLCIRGGKVTVAGDEIIADAGAWWDDVVQTSIDNSLWGIELLSLIPGSVGAGLYINIAAYGQSLGNSVEWVEVWDRRHSTVKKLSREDMKWGYKSSIFQEPSSKHIVIIRACFKLSLTQTTPLTYQKALDIAEELRLDPTSLEHRRTIIAEARKRAGSLWEPGDKSNHTVGSFFRNPVVSKELAEKVMNFDESGKTQDELKRMNSVHGGDMHRVSAAHVMLAAGFKRGQKWDNVKLNDQNLLKIEALPGATAQDIFTVARIIQETCKDKLGITLEPEARILGHFS